MFLLLLLSACGSAKSATQVPTQSPPTQSPFAISPQPQQPSGPATVVPSTQTPANPSDCTDSAAFVADVTVPDNTNFNQGDVVHKVWRVKNTGTCTWTAQYTLVFSSGDEMNAHSSTPLSATKPGDTLDIAVDLVAPSEDGTYRADFEIQNPSGVAMPIDQAKTLWVTITVGAAGASTSVPSTGASASASTGASTTASATTSGNSTSSSTGGTGLLSPTCAFTTDAGRVNDVIAAINAYRTQNGIAPYPVNPQLTQAAQSHSEDMACNNLFVHAGSDGSSPSSRMAAAGYSASYMTENVYGSYPPLSGGDAVVWWATDRTDLNHNLNLISRKYKEIGVGYAFFNNYGYYVVDFAAP